MLDTGLGWLAMAIMIDKSGKNAKNKGKNISPNEVSELLRNFYRPDEAGIQDFDEFYSQLRYKMDGAKTEIASSNKRDQIESDYERRERELKKMLVEMDTRDKTVAKRKLARTFRILAAILLSSLIVVAGVFAYQYLHKPKTVAMNLNVKQSAELLKIETEWQAYKLKQLALIEELKLKFNTEMQKPEPNTQLVAQYERQVLEAKAQLSQAKTKMLLAKKSVKA